MRSPEAKNILWYRTTAVLKEPKLQQLTKIEAKWTQAQMLEAKAQETTRLPSSEAFFGKKGYKSKPLLPLSCPAGSLGLDLQPEKKGKCASRHFLTEIKQWANKGRGEAYQQ